MPASSSAVLSSAAATPTQPPPRRYGTREAAGVSRASASEKSEKLLTIPDGTHIEYRLAERGPNDLRGQNRLCLGMYLLYDGKVRADGGPRLRSGPGES